MDPTDIGTSGESSAPSDEAPEQLQMATTVDRFDAGPPEVGSVPVGCVPVESNTLKIFKKKLDNIVNTLIAETTKSSRKDGQMLKQTLRNREWKEAATKLLAEAITWNDRNRLNEFCYMLSGELGVPMPDTGALWSDPDVGQVEARRALGAGGKVLADTPAGLAARHLKIAPQGRNVHRGESVEALAERNKVALNFWGALSEAYTSRLRGDVHIYLPKGITVGSIFWNDELPKLWERKHAGDVSNIYFHIQEPGVGWSAPKTIDEISIVDAYGADRTGVNKGAMSLADDSTPEHLRATLGTNFEVELKRPIRVGPLRAGLHAWAERARARLAERGATL